MRTDQMGSGPTMADGQIAAIVSMLAAVMSANDPENWKRGLRAAISRSQSESRQLEHQRTFSSTGVATSMHTDLR